MNKNLRDAIENVGKADALMYAIEQSYLDLEVSHEDSELAERRVFAFYAMWDAVNAIRDSLEKLEGDQLVVDAIYAVNKVKQHKATLTAEK